MELTSNLQGPKTESAKKNKTLIIIFNEKTTSLLQNLSFISPQDSKPTKKILKKR